MLTGGFYAKVMLGHDATIAQEKNGRPFGTDVSASDQQVHARVAERELGLAATPGIRATWRPLEVVTARSIATSPFF